MKSRKNTIKRVGGSSDNIGLDLYLNIRDNSERYGWMQAYGGESDVSGGIYLDGENLWQIARTEILNRPNQYDLDFKKYFGGSKRKSRKSKKTKKVLKYTKKSMKHRKKSLRHYKKK